MYKSTFLISLFTTAAALAYPGYFTLDMDNAGQAVHNLQKQVLSQPFGAVLEKQLKTLKREEIEEPETSASTPVKEAHALYKAFTHKYPDRRLALDAMILKALMKATGQERNDVVETRRIIFEALTSAKFLKPEAPFEVEASAFNYNPSLALEKVLGPKSSITELHIGGGHVLPNNVRLALSLESEDLPLNQPLTVDDLAKNVLHIHSDPRANPDVIADSDDLRVYDSLLPASLERIVDHTGGRSWEGNPEVLEKIALALQPGGVLELHVKAVTPLEDARIRLCGFTPAPLPSESNGLTKVIYVRLPQGKITKVPAKFAPMSYLENSAPTDSPLRTSGTGSRRNGSREERASQHFLTEYNEHGKKPAFMDGMPEEFDWGAFLQLNLDIASTLLSSSKPLPPDASAEVVGLWEMDLAVRAQNAWQFEFHSTGRPYIMGTPLEDWRLFDKLNPSLKSQFCSESKINFSKMDESANEKKYATWLQSYALNSLLGTKKGLSWVADTPPFFEFTRYLQLNPVLDHEFIEQLKLKEGRGLRNGEVAGHFWLGQRATWLQKHVVASLAGKGLPGLPWRDTPVGFDWKTYLTLNQAYFVPRRIKEFARHSQKVTGDQLLGDLTHLGEMAHWLQAVVHLVSVGKPEAPFFWKFGTPGLVKWQSVLELNPQLLPQFVQLNSLSESNGLDKGQPTGVVVGQMLDWLQDTIIESNHSIGEPIIWVEGLPVGFHPNHCLQLHPRLGQEYDDVEKLSETATRSEVNQFLVRRSTWVQTKWLDLFRREQAGLAYMVGMPPQFDAFVYLRNLDSLTRDQLRHLDGNIVHNVQTHWLMANDGVPYIPGDQLTEEFNWRTYLAKLRETKGELIPTGIGYLGTMTWVQERYQTHGDETLGEEEVVPEHRRRDSSSPKTVKTSSDKGSSWFSWKSAACGVLVGVVGTFAILRFGGPRLMNFDR